MTQAGPRGWLRYVFVRREVWKTTWTARVTAIALAAVLAWATSAAWTRALADGLVCSPPRAIGSVDAMLIDDLDLNYLPFERARILRQSGVSSRVLVPVSAAIDDVTASVPAELVKVMARLSRVGEIETVPIVEEEPISLNVALRIRQYLADNRIRSVAVVAPAFRSQRSMLIYSAVLAPSGIASVCVPVYGTRTPATWAQSWHGVQEIALQFAKLQYYRFYVLPFRLGTAAR